MLGFPRTYPFARCAGGCPESPGGPPAALGDAPRGPTVPQRPAPRPPRAPPPPPSTLGDGPARSRWRSNRAFWTIPRPRPATTPSMGQPRATRPIPAGREAVPRGLRAAGPGPGEQPSARHRRGPVPPVRSVPPRSPPAPPKAPTGPPFPSVARGGPPGESPQAAGLSGRTRVHAGRPARRQLTTVSIPPLGDPMTTVQNDQRRLAARLHGAGSSVVACIAASRAPAPHARWPTVMCPRDRVPAHPFRPSTARTGSQNAAGSTGSGGTECPPGISRVRRMRVGGSLLDSESSEPSFRLRVPALRG